MENINKSIIALKCCKKEITMIKLNNKNLKELILSGKHWNKVSLTLSEIEVKNSKNIVFRKVNNAEAIIMSATGNICILCQ